MAWIYCNHPYWFPAMGRQAHETLYSQYRLLLDFSCCDGDYFRVVGINAGDKNGVYIALLIVEVHFFLYHTVMAQLTIDLRNISPVKNSIKEKKNQGGSDPSSILSSDVSSNALSVLPFSDKTTDEIEWTGYEHELRMRGRYWFLYPIAAATIGIAFGIITKNYTFIALLAVSFIVLMVYAKRPPRLRTYRIEKRGVWVGGKLHEFATLKSFHIFEHPLFVPELLLETNQTLNPVLHLRLEKVDIAEIKKVMTFYLPEGKQKELASDQIARILGF